MEQKNPGTMMTYQQTVYSIGARFLILGKNSNMHSHFYLVTLSGEEENINFRVEQTISSSGHKISSAMLSKTLPIADQILFRNLLIKLKYLLSSHTNILHLQTFAKRSKLILPRFAAVFTNTNRRI